MGQKSSDPIQRNRRYIWRMYVFGVVGLLYALGVVFIAPGNARWIALWGMGGGVLLVIVLRWWIRRRAIRSMERMLQQPDPNVILAYYDRAIRTGGLAGAVVPDMELIKAHSKAIILAIYGEHDRSRSMVAGHDLSNRPP